MSAVFYDAEAEHLAVEPVPSQQPWDVGRVRLVHWLRDDNGNFGDHTLDLMADLARDLGAALLTIADEVAPPAAPVDDEPPRVYRDGDRIRRGDGQGYSDMVADAAVREHLEHAQRRVVELEADLMNARDDQEFCTAVLALREVERRG